jgi:hypothetical protein
MPEPLPWPRPRIRVRRTDPAAEHEIDLRAAGSHVITVGCRCTTTKVPLSTDAAPGVEHELYQRLPHRPALEATA